MINSLITHIKTWIADYYENIVIMSFAVLFAIGLAFAWNWNQSNCVTKAQLDAAKWRIVQLEKMQSYLLENARKDKE